MSEKPILFKPEMVRAILEGRKTQTRRVLKPQPTKPWGSMFHEGRRWWTGDDFTAEVIEEMNVPFASGDLLWVREAWLFLPTHDRTRPSDLAPETTMIRYEADGMRFGYGKFLPGMFMPRWASRITLRVTGVRVERLQDISEADAKAEGIERLRSGRGYYDPRYDHGAVHLGYCATAVEAYSLLWDSINGPGAWDANPWVAVSTFERVRP